MRPAATLVAIIVLVAAGCSDGTSAPADGPEAAAPSAAASASPTPSAAPSPSPSPTSTTPPEDMAPNQAEDSEALLAQFPAGKRPCALEVDADGRVFVTSFDGASVLEFAAGGTEPVGDFTTGVEPCGIAAIAGQLWVAELGTNSVVRYDPDSGEELARVTLESDPWDLQPGPRLLWVAERQTGRVLGIDPATAEIVVTSDDFTLPSGIEVTDDGTVWVADEQADEIVRIDGETGEVVSRIEAGSPRWFTESPGAVWASVVDDSEVWKLDAATGDVLARVDVGEGRVPLDLGYAQGWVWSPDSARGVIHMIDPDSAEIVGELKLLTGAWVAEPVGDQVWVTNFNYRVRGHIYVLDPEAMPPPFAER